MWKWWLLGGSLFTFLVLIFLSFSGYLREWLDAPYREQAETNRKAIEAINRVWSDDETTDTSTPE
jgi:hypothetical protein